MARTGKTEIQFKIVTVVGILATMACLLLPAHGMGNAPGGGRAATPPRVVGESR